MLKIDEVCQDRNNTKTFYALFDDRVIIELM